MTLRSPVRGAALLGALFAIAPITAAQAVPPPAGTVWKEYWFPSGDGTLLHADVLTPEGATKSPVILSIGPYFGHSSDTTTYDPMAQGPSSRFADMYTQGKLFQRGYALVMVDLRGFGASEGCNDFGGPGEQADSKAAVEWAASQPWSTGRVGMWGKSYDGWTEVMALAGKPKGLAAAVIMSPIIDGYRTLYMNGVHYDSGWYGTPAVYQSSDATPPSTFDSPEYFQHSALGFNPACYGLNIAEQTLLIDKTDPAGFWSARDLVARASASTVPVFWSHGFLDFNTKPDNFVDVYSHLAGPHRAWFGQYHHVRGNEVDQVGKKASSTRRCAGSTATSSRSRPIRPAWRTTRRSRSRTAGCRGTAPTANGRPPTRTVIRCRSGTAAPPTRPATTARARPRSSRRRRRRTASATGRSRRRCPTTSTSRACRS